jgi:imidazolonepropionase
MTIHADMILSDIRALMTCAGPAPLGGTRQHEISLIANATLASMNGRIVFAGPAAEASQVLSATEDAILVDGTQLSVVPGFVDPHTHVVFAGDRREELRRRLAGTSYAEIAEGGGGIVSTVAATRAASEGDLVEQARTRLDEMLTCGTTTCEAKSGYGLNLETELKMLRAIDRLNDEHDVDVVSTFLGAHEVPREFRARRTEYVDLVVNEMIPQVARARLGVEWCDVFCETGVFTPAESTRILQAGTAHGLKPRIHADELGASGGSQVAASVGARSADHLVHIQPDGIEALRRSGVTATLLPNAAFYLKLRRFAPARSLIDAGVPVALATDVNPGGGFSPSMPFSISIACFQMDMTFEEALAAATINAAWSLDRASEVGSLEPGKKMDAVLIYGDAVNLIRVGAPAIAGVIKDGRLVRSGHELRAITGNTRSSGDRETKRT